MDPGTTDHMSANRTAFKSYQAFKVAKPIFTGGGTIYAHGQGKIELFAKQQSGSPQKITLHNVLHVPSLIGNLMSISALRKKGAYWRSDTLTLHLTSNNRQFAQYREIDKLFALEEEVSVENNRASSTSLFTDKTSTLSTMQDKPSKDTPPANPTVSVRYVTANWLIKPLS